MAKQATEERLIQFRGDYWLMRRKYKNNQMALVLDVRPSNLSAYGRGKKNPGVEFLEKFYSIYGEELKEMAYNYPGKEFGPHTVENPATVKYLRTGERGEHYNTDDHAEAQDHDERADHINTLKKNNDTLLAGITKIIDTNRIAVRSTDRAIKTTEEAVKNNTIVTKNNTQLIHLFTSRLTIRRRRGGSGRK
ncbi:MAG TPA: hypothetical protein VNU72_03135 [Puia sp.]|jgi:hypothetical protein|nr:hypothetical protein [Puia sp.]